MDVVNLNCFWSREERSTEPGAVGDGGEGGCERASIGDSASREHRDVRIPIDDAGQEREQAHRSGVSAGFGPLSDQDVRAGRDRSGCIVEVLDLAHHGGIDRLDPLDPRGWVREREREEWGDEADRERSISRGSDDVDLGA